MLTVLYTTKFAIRVENNFMTFTIKIEVSSLYSDLNQFRDGMGRNTS